MAVVSVDHGSARRIPQWFEEWSVIESEVFDDPPVLRTDRLVLRAITESDGDALFDIFADDEVTEHYAWDRFTTVTQGHELAARSVDQRRRHEALRWGLVLAGSSDIIIGTCGYTRWNTDHRYAIVGYDLNRSYWHRGLMSEALTAVLRWGFEHLAVHRMEASVLAGNTASVALLERAGFHREGMQRERVLHRGSFRDLWLYGLLHREWTAQTTRPPAAG